MSQMEGGLPAEAGQLAEESDSTLVRLIGEGSTAAWEELFRRYYTDLSEGARRFLRISDRSRMDDIIDGAIVDVFLTLRSAGQRTLYQEEKGPLFPYLLVAVRNRLWTRLRDEARQEARSHHGPVTIEDVAAEGSSFLGDHEQQVELAEALNTLPEQQKQIVLLRYLYGYRPSEIGERLGIPSHRVSEILYLARSKLRRALQPLE